MRCVRFLAPALLGLMLSFGTAHAVSDPGELLANPEQEVRAEAIGQQLRCLVCQNESIEDSDAGLARDIRTIIRQQVVAGRTDPQIKTYMVQRYGSFILLEPPFDAMTLLLWATPPLALLLGLGIAVLFARRQQRFPEAPAPLTEAEQDRLRSLLPP